MSDLQANDFGIGSVLDMLKKVFAQYPNIDRVVLFGSRARGDYKRTSDIDLCIYGHTLNKNDKYNILDDIEELDTFYSFDIVFFDELNEEPIKESILRDMKKIYGR